MSVATLSRVLRQAFDGHYAVAGLVVLGWEDARAYVDAAEAENAPVILQAGPGCRAHTPLPVLASMFRHLAENASVPVVLHLDHGENIDICRRAIDLGFTSVMYDGSQLALAQNIHNSAAIVELAHAAGVSVEAELGVVGYADGALSTGTDPLEAARFASDTGVDALAISIGNRHLMTDASAEIDWERLRAIEGACPSLPLVIHGGSGISPALRRHLAATSNICKFNIGTELRQAFGSALRKTLTDNPDRFDRIAILKETMAPVTAAAREAIRSCRGAS